MAKRKKTTFDVKTHTLVPKHAKLSQKETKELFAKLNITVRDLPKISINDTAIEGLEVKAGDIVKIIRSSPTAGTAIFYRGVINE
jgi:DNA-directed RNA polymerase subunit H